MSAIRTENLCKVYKTPWGKKETSAVKMLNLEVKQGEVFGLLGPNGAGKTSTIHLLLNLIRPTAGVAFLFDRPVTETEVHRRLGYLPESVNLHTYYRGRALLNFYVALCGVPVEQRESRVTAVSSCSTWKTRPTSRWPSIPKAWHSGSAWRKHCCTSPTC